MNELTDEKRYQLKIVLILVVIILCVIYGMIMFLKYTKTTEEKQKQPVPQVIFQQPTLTFFSYKTQLNAYPDRITIHYPYLVVVHPEQFKSEIYNLDTKRKEKDAKKVILDYFNGNAVYNKQGYTTYFNTKDLELLCDQAFIKSKTEIFCITRTDQNSQDNKIILINPQSLQQKDIYTSQNVLTAVGYYNDTLYIGEYNFENNKAFITVNNKSAPIGDLVNVIYPMENAIYAASFKSLRNKQVESYYEIQGTGNQITTKLIKKGQIILF